MPNGETPEGFGKISTKTLYELLIDTKSHGLFSLKDTITELCKNLSLKILSREQQIEHKKISDLSAHLNFKIKHSILLNLERQGKDNKKNNQDL